MPSPNSTGHRLDGLKARRELAGQTITGLAKLSNTSDVIIVTAENGGSVAANVSQRILDALATPVAITSNSQASPTVLTTPTNSFQTGDTILIAGVVGSNADVNGTRVYTRTNATTGTVPVNCSVAGGTGGTATPTTATLGLVSLH